MDEALLLQWVEAEHQSLPRCLEMVREGEEQGAHSMDVQCVRERCYAAASSAAPLQPAQWLAWSRSSAQSSHPAAMALGDLTACWVHQLAPQEALRPADDAAAALLPAWARGLFLVGQVLVRVDSVASAGREQARGCEPFSRMLEAVVTQEPRLQGADDLVKALLTRDPEAALERMDNACANLAASPFTVLHAHALERMAALCLRQAHSSVARDLAGEAQARYHAWGGLQPVKRLTVAVPGLETSTITATTSGHTTNHTTHHNTRHSVAVTSHTTVGDAGLDVQAAVAASKALAGEVSEDLVVQRIIDSLRTVGGATRVILATRTASGLQINLDTARCPEAMPHLLFDYTLRTHEVVAVDSLQGAHTFVDPYIQTLQRGSLLCMPWRGSAATEGLVYLENNVTAKAFSRQRVGVVQFLAGQAAVALANAAVYRDMESAIAVRASATRTAEAKLQQSRQSNRELQMAGGFAHEMRNALAGARFAAATVAPLRTNDPVGVLAAHEEVIGQLEAHAQARDKPASEASLAELRDLVQQKVSALGIVREGIDRGMAVAQTILNFGRLAKEKPDFERTPLLPLVRDQLLQCAAKVEARGTVVTTQVAEDLMVPLRQEHVGLLLKHLLSNAIDAVNERAAGQPAGEVSIQASREGDAIALRIADNGVGIRPEHEARVFEPFFSTKGVQGMGLGLNVVQRISQVYGMELHVQSDVGRGCTVSLRIAATAPAAGVS